MSHKGGTSKKGQLKKREHKFFEILFFGVLKILMLFYWEFVRWIKSWKRTGWRKLLKG